ncbi:uncharacterized protein LOC131026736 [Cryptomeria japonica]|uniref:uncharacterized protein LOC131026736 n=1 Tax=Cryptomeria japonica TaxID=3369 RepID=UPI0027DA63DB|nr:uncharacterized protein LOC131026736 [Cryptomeria japonica]
MYIYFKRDPGYLQVLNQKRVQHSEQKQERDKIMGCCISAPVPLCQVHNLQLQRRHTRQKVKFGTARRINADRPINRHHQKRLEYHTNDFPIINAMTAERILNNVKEKKQEVLDSKDGDHKEKHEENGEDEYGRKSFTFPILVSSPEKDRL